MITDALKKDLMFNFIQEALKKSNNFGDFKEALLVKKEYDIIIDTKEFDKTVIKDLETGIVSHKITYNDDVKLNYIYDINNNKVIGPIKGLYIKNNKVVNYRIYRLSASVDEQKEYIDFLTEKIKESIEKNYTTF